MNTTAQSMICALQKLDPINNITYYSENTKLLPNMENKQLPSHPNTILHRHVCTGVPTSTKVTSCDSTCLVLVPRGKPALNHLGLFKVGPPTSLPLIESVVIFKN